MDTFPVFYSERRERNNLNTETHSVQIEDYREAATTPSLAKEGFMVVDNQVHLGDEQDPQVLEKLWYPPLIDTLKAITGAPKIVPTGIALRRAGDPKEKPEASNAKHNSTYGTNNKTAPFAHSDFDYTSFYGIAHRTIAGDPEAARWLGGRMAVIQVWRVLSAPPQDVPLAIMDISTAKPAQAKLSVACNGPVSLPTTLWSYDEHQRWGYFSNMTQRETLIFMGFDSANDIMPGPGHSAFDDPSCPKGVEPRRSCEARMLVFWGS
jgi:hypothetical protein